MPINFRGGIPYEHKNIRQYRHYTETDARSEINERGTL